MNGVRPSFFRHTPQRFAGTGDKTGRAEGSTTVGSFETEMEAGNGDGGTTSIAGTLGTAACCGDDGEGAFVKAAVRAGDEGVQVVALALVVEVVEAAVAAAATAAAAVVELRHLAPDGEPGEWATRKQAEHKLFVCGVP